MAHKWTGLFRFLPQRGLAVWLAVALAAGGVFVTGTLAAPANDDFAGALDIAGALFAGAYTSPTLVTSDPGGATREAAESPALSSCTDFPAAANTRSVWFRFTAAANGWVTLDTRLADYDTVLEVWTGPAPASASIGTLSLPSVACNDDAGKASSRSEITFPVTAGIHYYAMVRDYGASGAGGNLVLRGFYYPEHQIFVDQATGDDARNTGSQALPFRTLQRGVDAVTAGGAVNVAAGAYAEAVTLDRNLALRNSSGAPTAASFALINTAQLGAGSGGVTAPAVTVQPGSRIADGLLLASSGGVVTLGAGTFVENVVIDKSVTMQGPASGPRAIIAPSSGSAVTVSAGTVALNHLNFEDADTGLMVGGGAVTLYRSNLTGNALAVDAAVPVTAVENWWGDASGPAHATNPGGAGQPVSDGVAFSPWCTAAAPACTPLRGLVAQLVFTTQPVDTGAGSPISPPVVVEAQDAFGNATAFTGTIALALDANPGGGALGGTSSRNAVGGVATFNDLSIDQPGLGYTLAASATVPGLGVFSAVSAAFDIFNNAPVAADDTDTLLEDGGPLTLDVLANDSDPESDPLRILSVTAPVNGGVLASTTLLTYTPVANFFGVDVFTYTMTDLYGSGLATATVTVTVTAVNDPPAFTKGADQTVDEDAGPQSVVGWATGIAPGPANEAGQSVTFSVTSTNPVLFSAAPAVGAAGTLTFTPAANANGAATVYVTAQDNGGAADGGQDMSATQTFSLQVLSVNDAPSFTLWAGTVTVDEDSGPFSQSNFAVGLTPGPADEAGQSLTFLLTTTNDSLFAVLPALDSAGALTFTPAANANGAATITVRLQDDGGTARGGQDTSAPQTLTIAITPLGDPPDAVDDALSTLEDAPVTFDPRANDSEPDGGALNVIAVGTTPDGAVSFTAASVAYTPTADFNGAAVFTYTVGDGVLTDTAAVTVAVTAVNDPPSFALTAASVTVAEDSGAFSQNGFATNILRGPADESGQALTFLVTTTNDSLFSALPALDEAGALTFTPALNAHGAATISVRLRDNGGVANGGQDTSAAQTFTVTLTPVNDRPDFTNGGDQAVNEDAGAQTVAGWALPLNPGPNESGQTLTFAVTTTNDALFSALPAVSEAGTLTYTPAPNANGSAAVYVTARDDGGTASGGEDASLTRVFTLTVHAVNDAPSFALSTGAVTVDEDSGPFSQSSFAAGLAPGPADEAGQALTFTVTTTNDSLFSALPALTPGGTLTFTPAPNANGAVTVAVRLQDDGGIARGGQDASALQTFTLAVSAVPDAPLAVSDTFTVTEDVPAAFAVLANDLSVDGGVLSVLNYTAPAHGGLAAGSPLTYTPAVDYFGADAFTYVITDAASGLTATAAVSLNILPVNDAPLFTKGMDIAMDEDSGAVTFFNWASGIAAGPANESAQALTFTLTTTAPGLFTTPPALGANGTLTFTPAPHANGVVTVTATLRDSGGTATGGQDTSAAQTFTIALNPVNDPPTANADSAMVMANSVGNVLNVLANDSSAPDAGETLTLTAVGVAAHGVVALGGASLIYTPTTDFTGTDAFTYTISDGNGGAASALVTVTVNPALHFVRLPLVVNNYRPLPDLVGGFSLNPANPAANQPVVITVVITNQGAAVARNFWVDFYINPNPAPTAANQPWDSLCQAATCKGLAWFVTGALAPGQSLTLTSSPGSFYGPNTCWDGNPDNPARCQGLPPGFPAGTTALYLYVDSWNPGVAAGALEEVDETNNRFLRTGFGPLGGVSAFETRMAARLLPPAEFDLRLPRPAWPGQEGK